MGSHVAMPDSAPLRRMSKKGPLVVGKSDGDTAREGLVTLLKARIGPTDITDISDASSERLAKQIKVSDQIVETDGREAAKAYLASAVKRLCAAGCTSDSSAGLDGKLLDEKEKPLAGEGQVWVVCDPLSSRFGVTVDLGPGSLVKGDYGIGELDGAPVAVCRRRLVTLPDYVAECHSSLKKLLGGKGVLGGAGALGASEEEAGDLRARLGRPARPVKSAEGQEDSDGDGAVAKTEDAAKYKQDVRTLWVQFDDHGERFREWRSVCMDARAVAFSDGWEKYHEGPSSTLDLMKNFQRAEQDPMRWLAAFLKEFDIAAKERTAIELRTLCRALWLNGVYDQCNTPALASMEELSRRLCQIVEAYVSAGTGKTPNWTSVKHFTTVHTTGSVVPGTLRTFAHKKVKDEVEAENLRLRAQNAFPAAALASDDGDLSTAFPRAPKGPKPKKPAVPPKTEPPVPK